jgi:hypothetical protein
MEQSQATAMLHLPSALDVPDATQMAWDYIPIYEGLSDCQIDYVEMAHFFPFSTAISTATHIDSERCRAFFFSTASDHTMISIPAYNGSDTAPFIAEMLSPTPCAVISPTSHQPIDALIDSYDIIIPIPYERSG